MSKRFVNLVAVLKDFDVPISEEYMAHLRADCERARKEGVKLVVCFCTSHPEHSGSLVPLKRIEELDNFVKENSDVISHFALPRRGGV